MAPPSTGHLELRGGVWHVRLSKGSGKDRRREWYDLGTADKRVAERRKAKLLEQIAAGKTPQQAAAALPAAMTVEEWAASWNAKRKAQKIASARDDEQRIRDYALERLGKMQLPDVRPTHIAAVLDDAVEADLSLGTVKHILAAVGRLFKAAWRAELIPENPALKVEMPRMKKTRKASVQLHDDEFVQLIDHLDKRVHAVDAWEVERDRVAKRDGSRELRMLCACSRILGGMRTSDVNRWDYQQIDTINFAHVIIPRTKTEDPQDMKVPNLIRHIIRDWWERAGRPTSGPVFPVRRGANAGGFKATRGVSYAARLRRECKAAGLGRRELYVDTARTRRVDFHSLRGAFASALANAPGVSMQQAMKLTSHSDPRTHLGYVEGATEIPDAAVPKLTTGDHQRLAPTIGQSEEDPSKSARHRGFEPLAFGSGGRCDDHGRPYPSAIDKATASVEGPVDHARSPALPPDWPALATADDASDFIRPRVAPAASGRAGRRLEHGLRVVLGSVPSANPEAELLTILGAACDDLGLSAGGAS